MEFNLMWKDLFCYNTGALFEGEDGTIVGLEDELIHNCDIGTINTEQKFRLIEE